MEANEDAAGGSSEPARPQSATLTDELKAQFNSNRAQELYLFVSGKAKISATEPEMPIHKCLSPGRGTGRKQLHSTVCQGLRALPL